MLTLTRLFLHWSQPLRDLVWVLLGGISPQLVPTILISCEFSRVSDMEHIGRLFAGGYRHLLNDRIIPVDG